MIARAMTRQGAIEGERRQGLQVFRGIPYARPARGSLRWQAPEPVEPWAGVWPANRFGPSAPQSPPVMRVIQGVIGGGSNQSQDCLYLNVWTPACDAGRRPVMVWIHGGAFLMGSGSTALYSGDRLARRGDAVVITINYRLGALGFLNARDVWPGSTANQGIRDQIAALEWVRDNVEAFGGDPENVTVFGESAGAMSVGTLLAVPSARGLFRRAILQSGAAHQVCPQEQATAVAHTFFEAFGSDDRKKLEEASVSDILAAQRAATVRTGFALGGLPWQPSVDGDLIPRAPLAALAAGTARDVAVLIGTNRDEFRLFMLGDRRGRRLDEEGLERRLARALPGEDDEGRPHVERALEAYRAAGRLSPAQIYERFQSDRLFHYPAHRLAELQSAHAPTYAYLFDWAPPALRGRVGACHGMEIPFVFGTLRSLPLAPMFGLAPGALRLSDHMQRAWLAFARNGDPACDPLPAWPRYDADGRSTLVFATRCSVEDAPFADTHGFWSEFAVRYGSESGEVGWTQRWRDRLRAVGGARDRLPGFRER